MKTVLFDRNHKCSRKKKKKSVQREYNEAEDVYLDKLNDEILAEVEAEKIVQSC